MSRVIRLFKRLFFYSFKECLVLISRFNHRVYMSGYVRLLKMYGMTFTGTPRYIGARVVFDDIDLISLGERVVISDHCHFLTHDYSLTTTLISQNLKPKTDVSIYSKIIIGNNVFIGKKTIVMPNSSIGDNVIVGAGSVVRGKLQSNSIYAGNPCIRIRSIDEHYNKLRKKLDKSILKYD